MRAVIRRWRKLFVFAAVITAAGALFLVDQRAGGYESTGTYVVRPQVGDESDAIRATANLSGTAKTTSTFAYIAEGDLIGERARERLERVDPSLGSYEVEAAVAPGTNVVTISVRSDDPTLAYDMAIAVGAETVAYIADLGDVYTLGVIDPPTDPQRLLTAWVNPIWLTSAGFVGIIVGLAAVLAADTLFPRGFRRDHHNPIPFASTDGGDATYTRLRLREEMARADDSGVPLKLAVMSVKVPDFEGRRSGAAPLDEDDIPRIAQAVTPLLRGFEHLRHVGDAAGTFAAILPSASDARVATLTRDMRSATVERLDRGMGAVKVVVSACTYQDHEFSGDTEARVLAEQLAGEA